jgi:hypothetical protein
VHAETGCGRTHFESEPRDDVEPMLSANLHPWPPSCDGCWFGPLRLCFYRRKPKNRGANFFGWLGMLQMEARQHGEMIEPPTKTHHQ